MRGAQPPCGLDILDDALVAQQAGDQQEGRRLRRHGREAVVLGIDARALDPDQRLAGRDDPGLAKVVEVVPVLEQDRLAAGKAGAIQPRRHLAQDPALELAALDEGVAQPRDHGEDVRHAGEPRRAGAVDHRLCGIG